jgi:hypothetical protein
LASCVALQIYWLNLGLAKFDAISNVPVFQCLWMLFGVISGGVFFREFSTFDARQALFFPLGVSLCLAGVFVLSSRPTDQDNEDAEDGGSGNDSDSDSETSSNDTMASPLISDSGGSSSDYNSDVGSTGSTLGYDSQDYPNRMELPEYDAVFYDGPMGLGLYPEIVKITHPQYERVQGMVKVWRVRDLPRVPGDGVVSTANASGGGGGGDGGGGRGGGGGGGGGSSKLTLSSAQGSKESNTLQPGPAEKQEISEDMMLVGINGESILRQRNTWRETLLRLMHTARPMVLTFRVIPTGAGLLPGKNTAAAGEGKNNVDGSGSSMPNTPNSIRGSREIHRPVTTPNGFTDMIHAGQISLSENRKRSTDSRGNLRYGPKSTNGRLRYKELHHSKSQRTRRSRARSKRTNSARYANGVLDSQRKLQNRPMMSGTLTMFHQPESVSFQYVPNLFCVFVFFLFVFVGTNTDLDLSFLYICVVYF